MDKNLSEHLFFNSQVDGDSNWDFPFPPWISTHLPKTIKSLFFKSEFGNLHLLHGGTGKPVLFVHGNPTWSFLWRKVIGELDSEKFQFFAPDLLNLGFSDSLGKKDFSMENQSMALVELIEKLDMKNITVVVQDWGGPIGLYAASLVPERIQSLVILNTGISPPKPPYKISKFHSFVNRPILPDIAFRFFGMPLYHLHKVQGDANSIAGDIASAYRYPIKIKGRWDSALKFARLVPAQKNDSAIPLMQKVEDFVASFAGPIEVVWGLRDPILGRALKKVRNIIPNASYTETQGGHFLQEECPKEIARAIERASD